MHGNGLFIKMGHSQPLFVYFWSFQISIQLYTTNKCENDPSSVQHWNSNSWPLGGESPPITTRPMHGNVACKSCVRWDSFKNLYVHTNKRLARVHLIFCKLQVPLWPARYCHFLRMYSWLEDHVSTIDIISPFGSSGWSR